MPKVSVIIPVFNVEPYLKDCLDSVGRQTLKDIEVICVENESTDNSLGILREYAKQDTRFKILNQSNRGPGVARNNALQVAKGKYVAFVDADDRLELGMLEQAYAYAKQHDAEVVQFNYQEYREQTGKYKKIDLARRLEKQYKIDIHKIGFYNKESVHKGLFYNLYNQVWNRIYKKEFIDRNHIRFSTTYNGEDHLFTIGVLLLADKIYFLDKYLYTYRVRKGSACHTWDIKDISYTVENIRQLEQWLKENKLYELNLKSLSEYRVQVLYWVREKLPLESVSAFEKTIKNCLTQEEWEQYFNLTNQKNLFQKIIDFLKR